MKSRDLYMKTLLEFKDKKVIKIVTGMRRSGKSTLLELFAERLRSDGVTPANIIIMNFESMQYDSIVDYRALYGEIKNKIELSSENNVSSAKFYLIFDEIQMISGWEKAINSFLVDFNVDVYITGSNAFLLSSELSTLLSGRYVEIRMLPLSFKEYLHFNAFEPSVSMDTKFDYYLKYGGLPALSEFGQNQQRINDMLEGVYSTVILKDVIQRNKIADHAMLHKLVLFLADNIGNMTSPHTIGNSLAKEGDIDEGKRRKNPASKTVESYIRALENAYIFYSAKRYDIKGRQYLKTLEKYYIVDIGLRNMLLGYRDMDRGHILENVVYFELKRRGYDVSIGKVGEKEIDFIAVRQDDKRYYQVTESLLDAEVRKREIAPLKDINDNYTKVVLSMDRSFINSDEGIQLQNIIDFLLEDYS